MTWEELEEKCKTCEKCSLCKNRHNVVFGCGNKKAEILFVGEAPGETEDLKGEPFVGRAGKLLDLYLESADIKREDVYIANILKCRPPSNRDPLPEEQDECIGYLREQFRLIDPKLVVCLGRISAMRLIKPDFRITKEHGVFFNKNGYTFCAVYHPSALLRDPIKKEDAYIDFQNIKKKLAQLKEKSGQ